MLLSGKKVLIGITGGIAAYKSALIIRLFKKLGAEVKVIMTSASSAFITPLTCATLSGNEVYTSLFDENTGMWTNHVDLAKWADVFLIAPLTANSLAKMAVGQADNLLLTTYLSASCPVIVAPAMDLDMYAHPTTTANLEKIESYGGQVIPAEYGELASGLVGKGRMASPETIVEGVVQLFGSKMFSPLQGKTVLITAGPTYEHIDPVRFIGNHSSGKMGFAVAASALRLGARVILVTGPTIQKAEKGIERKDVVSAEDMYNEVMRFQKEADIIIMSAAVADYTVKDKAEQKIKKKGNTLDLSLQKTKDILFEVGAVKRADQLLVGFALETNNGLAHAQGKLEKKKLDFIVLNSLKDKGAGFGTDTNKVTIIDKDNNIQEFELKSKDQVADDILNKVVSLV